MYEFIIFVFNVLWEACIYHNILYHFMRHRVLKIYKNNISYFGPTVCIRILINLSLCFILFIFNNFMANKKVPILKRYYITARSLKNVIMLQYDLRTILATFEIVFEFWWPSISYNWRKKPVYAKLAMNSIF